MTFITAKLLIKPFWTAETAPDFLKRTATKYAKFSHKDLLDRQLTDNRLFTSLINFLPDGAVIAGGFMTSVMADDKKAKDIDIFFTSAEAFDETLEQLLHPEWVKDNDDAWAWGDYKLDTDAVTVSQTDCFSLRFIKFVHPTRPPIQLVKLVWYEDPAHVIDSFDFTISQFAATNDAIYANPLSFFDLIRKRIVLHRMQFPASTLRRLVKYAGKGYYACPGSLATIAAEVAKSIESNPDEVNAIVYVD